jgi:IS30 family transposase
VYVGLFVCTFLRISLFCNCWRQTGANYVSFFSFEEKFYLQSNLREGHSFKEIRRILGKDPRTISREVRKYSSKIATCYSGQRAIEVNHELIRRNLSKGTSFEQLT